MRIFCLITVFLAMSTIAQGDERSLDRALKLSGENRPQIAAALQGVDLSRREGMEWMIEHMPLEDLQNRSGAFLIDNVNLAYDAIEAAPWGEDVPVDVFYDAVLPFASVNERRDEWRAQFKEQFTPLVAHATTPAQAAAILNNKVFDIVGVKYSTKRPKPDQSPLESIEAGLASCTGLSVLLIDACRSVGVPARFVGTSRWADNSGNHSWVEVWSDGKWHFTGAAEPTGDDLDKAWFTSRAADAREGDPVHGIYAVTWEETPRHFPMVWRPEDKSVDAVDVTWRYTSLKEALPEGKVRVRFRAVDRNGDNIAIPIEILDKDQMQLAHGETRDGRHDFNDHWTAVLPLGETVTIEAGEGTAAVTKQVKVEADRQLVLVEVPGYGVNQVAETRPLSAVEARAIKGRRLRGWARQHESIRRAALNEGVVRFDGHEMPIAWRVEGEAPKDGRSLYISLHGGGGAPAHVNDQQWRNQQGLYDIEEGVYVAPRAPTNTWDLWHREHVDGLLDRLIQDMVLVHGVNPNRVYLTGYSAGGDGVFQLAPRMADRFAAAAMMAGHPNETKPDGLRDLPFTLHMGENDSAYNRNQKAREWGQRLDELQASDPGGYVHEVVIHEGKGHWMGGQDAAGIEWMSQFERDLRPDRVVWLQDDVLQNRFYWLKVDAPKARDRMVVSRSGQVITIEEPGVSKTLHIRLDDDMLDLDKPVTVLGPDGETLFEDWVPRTAQVIEETLQERGDPSGVFTAEIKIELSDS
ncbi:MAG: hypothetical protein MK101_03320 [Phycisphaerales bacterium]|nr:hypothetical protein [Phycisphaerales bacterium]